MDCANPECVLSAWHYGRCGYGTVAGAWSERAAVLVDSGPAAPDPDYVLVRRADFDNLRAASLDDSTADLVAAVDILIDNAIDCADRGT